MDKYTGYVLVVYVVTFVMLVGYLVWMWARLRAASQRAALEDRQPGERR